MTIQRKILPISRRRFVQGGSALAIAGMLPAAFPIRSHAAEGGTLKVRSYAMCALSIQPSARGADEEIRPRLQQLCSTKPGGSGWQLDAAP